MIYIMFIFKYFVIPGDLRTTCHREILEFVSLLSVSGTQMSWFVIYATNREEGHGLSGKVYFVPCDR